MGVLAPLYLAGLAALSLPLILHLVRRTPRGRQDFSSLMFLTPSPPRLTRRSRLDQILLLLMRLAALALLAFAFARPFFREAATLSLSDLPTKRVAILVDTSASMRRGDLWQQAIRQIEKELNELAPHDEVALFTFNERLQNVVDFDASQSGASASQTDIIRQALRALWPTWGATDLGTALTTVASELESASDVRQIAAEPQIVLISDFQKGSRLESLQAFEWPERVRVLTRTLSPRTKTNAFAHLLRSEEDAPDAEPRVRVVNAADSPGDQFFVSWTKDGAKNSAESEIAVYVPPGQSRVVRLPRPEDNLQADRVVLRGDDHEFDNAFFLVPPRKQEVKLLYAGNDAADDTAGPQYYLRLATSGDPLRQVEVLSLDDNSSLLTADPPPQLVVATRALASGLVAALKSYVERGGTLLVALHDRDAAGLIPMVLDDVELANNRSTAEGKYLLLGEIDFTHPLFVPFANPRYSDFTKIHFWKHQSLVLKSLATTHVVARFDNGDPALLDRTSGQGRVYVLASGWSPDDSQLALSTKFVPLVGALLDRACGTGETLAGVSIGESVAFPGKPRAAALVIHKPDGGEVRLPADAGSFSQTDQPGVYHVGAGAEELRFAVNLAAAESNTAPLELEQLEQLGVRLGADLTRTERLSRIRQQRDTELEGRQKIWRWLIVGTLGVLVLETWWAGRAARQVEKSTEAVG